MLHSWTNAATDGSSQLQKNGKLESRKTACCFTSIKRASITTIIWNCCGRPRDWQNGSTWLSFTHQRKNSDKAFSIDYILREKLQQKQRQLQFQAKSDHGAQACYIARNTGNGTKTLQSFHGNKTTPINKSINWTAFQPIFLFEGATNWGPAWAELRPGDRQIHQLCLKSTRPANRPHAHKTCCSPTNPLTWRNSHEPCLLLLLRTDHRNWQSEKVLEHNKIP